MVVLARLKMPQSIDSSQQHFFTRGTYLLPTESKLSQFHIHNKASNFQIVGFYST